VPPIEGHVGYSYMATQASKSISFGDLVLADDTNQGWHAPDAVDTRKIRFSQGNSRLPSLRYCGAGNAYEVTFVNFSPAPIDVKIQDGASDASFVLQPGQEESRTVDAGGRSGVGIQSSVYVPARVQENGDMRTLGVAVSAIRLV